MDTPGRIPADPFTEAGDPVYNSVSTRISRNFRELYPNQGSIRPS